MYYAGCRYAKCRYAECHDLFIFMMIVVMLSVNLLSVVMLNVVAPLVHLYSHLFWLSCEKDLEQMVVKGRLNKFFFFVTYKSTK